MKDSAFIDSIELTRAFQQGEQKALEIYFREFYPVLTLYADSFTHDMETAKEIASEAFYKTWKYRAQFINAGSVRAYLYTIVRRDASRWHIKNQGNNLTALQGIDDVESLDPGEFARIVKAETLRHIYNAIETLPGECRKVFRMLYVDGKKTTEIASELNISPSTVKAQKARGLTLLRKKILLLVIFIFLLAEKIILSL